MWPGNNPAQTQSVVSTPLTHPAKDPTEDAQFMFVTIKTRRIVTVATPTIPVRTSKFRVPARNYLLKVRPRGSTPDGNPSGRAKLTVASCGTDKGPSKIQLYPSSLAPGYSGYQNTQYRAQTQCRDKV